MYKINLKKLAIVSIVVLTSISYSCKKDECCDGGKNGTIVNLTGFDGCGLVVKLENGKYLEVTNLFDFDFDLKEGDEITISYHEDSDAMSICMVGKIVKANCICKGQ